MYQLPSNCKFSVIAVQHARAVLPDTLVLPDDTVVLTGVPFELQAHWQQWLGTLVIDSLRRCNLVFLRIATSGWEPGSLSVKDGLNDTLSEETAELFAVLGLIGTMEYQDAFELSGCIENGESNCRTYAKLGKYHQTWGYIPWKVTEAVLQEAATLHLARKEFSRRFSDLEALRVWRGYRVLTIALQRHRMEDRMHGFIRALEALILPKPKGTEDQFVKLCSLFAASTASEANARLALGESYRVRSDIEHMHVWNRTLSKKYAASECEDIALLRTRQMDELARWAYRQVFTNKDLQKHFTCDDDIRAFWELPEAEIRSIFGTSFDISRVPKVTATKIMYGRAHPSEWPNLESA